jgi:hypothetical protein
MRASIARANRRVGRDVSGRCAPNIPEKGSQLVHYYGAYSNAHRGIAARRAVKADPEMDEIWRSGQ